MVSLLTNVTSMHNELSCLDYRGYRKRVTRRKARQSSSAFDEILTARPLAVSPHDEDRIRVLLMARWRTLNANDWELQPERIVASTEQE
jgi:hypothetical protein